MNPWRQLAVIAAVSLGAAVGTFGVKGPPSRVFRCDPATLKPDEICLAAIPAGADVVWVDARPRADWEKNGVPGSLLWNLDASEDLQAFSALFCDDTDGAALSVRFEFCGLACDQITAGESEQA